MLEERTIFGWRSRAVVWRRGRLLARRGEACLELVPERLPNAAAARWLVHDVRDHDEEQEQQETQDVDPRDPRTEINWNGDGAGFSLFPRVNSLKSPPPAHTLHENVGNMKC